MIFYTGFLLWIIYKVMNDVSLLIRLWLIANWLLVVILICCLTLTQPNPI